MMGEGQRQRGQATVELMLVLPVIITLAMLVAQVGLVGRDTLLVHHAARAAAREAAVNPTSSAATTAAYGSSKLDPGRMNVSLSGGRSRGDYVTATVTYSSPTRLPLIGRLLPDVGLRADVTMRVE